VESLRDADESERLMSDVDEVERSVNHTIEYARLPDRQGADPRADLADRIRHRLAFWSVLAREQGRQMTVSVPADVIIVGASGDRVDAVVDALVGNFAHTPVGTPFSVSVQPGPPARLVVADEGPGLGDPGLLDRGRSGAGSTGLGLDIARRTAEASGGGLEVTAGAGGRGLRVVVTFGAA
jgi:signal transduction histidine kinase